MQFRGVSRFTLIYQDNSCRNMPCTSSTYHGSSQPLAKLVKNTSVIKVATMKNTDNFHYVKEAIMWYHQIDTFCYKQR